MLRWSALIFAVATAVILGLAMVTNPVAAAMANQEDRVDPIGGAFNRAPCKALGFEFGTKIESPVSDVAYLLEQTDGETVTLDVHEGNRSFNFETSGFNIFAVVVKGGPTAKIYRYPDGTDQGDDLQPPDRTFGGGSIPQPFEISYIAFCYGEGGDGEPQPAPEPGEGSCGLGYWKNHPGSWPTEEYSPDTLLSDVFENAPADLADMSLMDALRFGGGPGRVGAAKLLLRTSVVSLLNASHAGIIFAVSKEAIIEQVSSALSSSDRRTIMATKTALDSLNSKGCPLAGGGQFERPKDPFPATTACMVDFWLKHVEEWQGWYEGGLVGDGPDTRIQDLFDLTPFMVDDTLNLGVEGDTLLDALSFKGGPGEEGAARELLREAVAAWLNQEYFEEGYGYQGDLIAAVDEALTQGRQAMLDLAQALYQLNSAECLVIEEELEEEARIVSTAGTFRWILRVSAELNQNMQPIYLPFISAR
jgi:hypothetical protein